MRLPENPPVFGSHANRSQRALDSCAPVFQKGVLFDLLMGGIGVALPTPFLEADSANATVANGQFMCRVH